jgi:hypothetical protein
MGSERSIEFVFGANESKISGLPPLGPLLAPPHAERKKKVNTASGHLA